MALPLSKLPVLGAYALLLGSLVGLLGSPSCYVRSCDDDDDCACYDDDDDDGDVWLDDDDDFDDDDCDDGNDDDEGFHAAGGGRDQGRAYPGAGAAWRAPAGELGLGEGSGIARSSVRAAPPLPSRVAMALVPAWRYRLVDFRAVPSEDERAHPLATIEDVRGLSLAEVLGPGTWTAADFEAFACAVVAVNVDLLGLPPGAGRLELAGARFAGEGIVVELEQLVPAGDGSSRRAGHLALCFDGLARLVRIEIATRFDVRTTAR